jgi:acid stress-induced BolA-like protein IbaG/YrbA
VSELIEVLAAIAGMLVACGLACGLGYLVVAVAEELARQRRVRRRQQIERNTQAAIHHVHASYRWAAEEAIKHATRRQMEEVLRKHKRPPNPPEPV